jgi:hypothetical protein
VKDRVAVAELAERSVCESSKAEGRSPKEGRDPKSEHETIARFCKFAAD